MVARFLLIAVLAGLPLLNACDRRSSDAKRLEVWTLALSPYFDDYLTGVFGAFEAEHPGTEVVWVDVPFDAINRKLVAAAAAGRAPDVVNLSDRDFARVAALGGLADLDPLLADGVVERYLPGAVRGLRLNGGLRALPWYLTTQVRMANAATLARGGLTPDTLANDWTGLRDQARAYHEETGGFLFSVPLGETSELPMMLLSEGIRPFRETPDGLVADLTREEVAGYVSAWVDLYREGALPRAAATRDHTHLVEGYQKGEIALIQTGSNMLGRIRDAAPDVYGETVVKPGVTGRLQRSHIAAMVVGVSGRSEHPEEAAALAAFLTSPASQTGLSKQSGVLPSTPASLDDPYFAFPEGASDDPEARLTEARATSAASLRTAVAFTPAMETWPELRRAFNEGIKRALLGGEPTAGVLASIEAEWNRILAAARPVGPDALPPASRVPRPLGGGVGSSVSVPTPQGAWHPVPAAGLVLPEAA
ncbi:ABC transporter substrate-binding protein [Phycisphaera mikurensis]|uniref:Putative ABC transporter substrate binding protein n=1 Tax=Phycisphaera mikurensis (strain NBRC 102666 / KCTC 22515 / FYK2301M01) TaxID=1142394 RepID=I0IDX1_PHYMF|nr:extracellular solute-binding protein [Phycisphaera mikurensis]MBB6441266.1 putative chitobiose transport system substrate-binding protein [Phycisphaera mikurensis]BAM03459.1 putative ABC transporter substrate binding protein [Phycisphaera mikurensis NBRC 102666]